ncbi:MAG: hypothetical protein KF760_11240 [Candidatus Eremiobacteraeota bacterium]|nr:hypothetical protein [Candidatus Eremiobacteraeota bacterium]MCW5870624.1 hypothetical protein [Candidatus Eremiobacteraeota bacterium]
MVQPLRRIYDDFVQGRRTRDNALDCLDAYEHYLARAAYQAQSWAAARQLQLQMADALEYLIAAADCLRNLVCAEGAVTLFEKYLKKAEQVLLDVITEAAFALQDNAQLASFYAS